MNYWIESITYLQPINYYFALFLLQIRREFLIELAKVRADSLKIQPH